MREPRLTNHQVVRRSLELSPETKLACAMVHEIGHRFLGHNMHSSRVIMRPRWRAGDLREMEIDRPVSPSEQEAFRSSSRGGPEARNRETDRTPAHLQPSVQEALADDAVWAEIAQLQESPQSGSQAQQCCR